MDNELLKALSTLFDEKLEPIKNDIKSLKSDVTGLKDDVAGLKGDVAGLKDDVVGLKGDVAGLKGDVAGLKDDVVGLKDDVVGLKGDVAGLKDDVVGLKKQQEESYQILKSLEHKAEVNKAEHDKFSNEIAHLAGEIQNMRKDLLTVEMVTARNMENIAQLKIIK